MQQTYRLYGKLRREMEARWEVLCQAAADAAAKEAPWSCPGAIPSTAACPWASGSSSSGRYRPGSARAA